jgi:hypothetical protein
MNRIGSCHFTMELWKNTDLSKIGLQCRYEDITSNKGRSLLISIIVGYCKGENLYFRPKNNSIAIMCFKDGEHFWFHLSRNEFNKVSNLEEINNENNL